MSTCDEPCDHLFEAATLSAQLVEAETARDDMQGALAGLINGVEFGFRRYAEMGDGLIVAALERAREALAWLSPSAGQEGRPRPGSEAAGKETESPVRAPGLDTATIEACARACESAAEAAVPEDDPSPWLRCVAARIRALATPPGQAKP